MAIHFPRSDERIIGAIAVEVLLQDWKSFTYTTVTDYSFAQPLTLNHALQVRKLGPYPWTQPTLSRQRITYPLLQAHNPALESRRPATPWNDLETQSRILAMDTAADPYELVLRGKRASKRAEQTVAKSTSPSATKTIATNVQPPEASLLGLPKELLNYIIELAVLKDSDEDPTEANVEFKQLKGGQRVFRDPTPSPALGRTCKILEAIVLPIFYGQNTFAFRSTDHASCWLSLKRRRWGMALVRRIRIRFAVKGMQGAVSQRKKGENVEVELLLRDKTGKLALAARCSFFARACQWCLRVLLGKIRDINGRTHCYKSGLDRLLALFEYLSDKAGLRLLADESWDCGCD